MNGRQRQGSDRKSPPMEVRAARVRAGWPLACRRLGASAKSLVSRRNMDAGNTDEEKGGDPVRTILFVSPTGMRHSSALRSLVIACALSLVTRWGAQPSNPATCDSV